MAQRLYDASGAKKMLYMIDGGLHKDLFVRDGDSLVWAINRFASDLPRSARRMVEPIPLLDHVIDAAFRYLRHHFRRGAVPKTL
jgi:hypothetical protein